MTKSKIRKANHMPLDKNLVRLRKSKGLTQDTLSEMTGVHINSIRAYEAGRASPSAEAVKKIAMALSVTTDEIIFDTNERAPNQDLRLSFEALGKLPELDQMTITNLINSLVVKNQTLNMANLLEGKKGA